MDRTIAETRRNFMAPTSYSFLLYLAASPIGDVRRQPRHQTQVCAVAPRVQSDAGLSFLLRRHGASENLQAVFPAPGTKQLWFHVGSAGKGA
jgi:hypothetical protein